MEEVAEGELEPEGLEEAVMKSEMWSLSVLAVVAELADVVVVG